MARPASTPKRILIVRLSALGDTALTMPLLAALRAKLPEAFIGWIANRGPSELLEGLKGLDRLHVLRKTGGRIAGVGSAVREIARERYDVALDAQGLTKSAMLPFLARVPLRVGLAPGRVEGRELSRFLNNRLVRPPPRLRHIVARTLRLGAALDLEMPEYSPVEMPVDPRALERMRTWWTEHGLPVEGRGETIFLGVGAGWPTKVWPVEKVMRLAEAACSRGLRAVFQWGPAEQADIPRWRRLLPEGALIAPATTVRELVALISLAERYAGPDSAALHIASLLGLPTFSWFGASDPERVAPRGDGHVHLDAGVDCAPCWKRKCRSMECITELDENRALPVFEEWLRAPDRRALAREGTEIASH